MKKWNVKSRECLFHYRHSDEQSSMVAEMEPILKYQQQRNKISNVNNTFMKMGDVYED